MLKTVTPSYSLINMSELCQQNCTHQRKQVTKNGRFICGGAEPVRDSEINLLFVWYIFVPAKHGRVMLGYKGLTENQAEKCCITCRGVENGKKLFSTGTSGEERLIFFSR
jgi:hypothetical protein